MSHQLFVRNGKASMMYVGEPPWHQLGTRLEAPASSQEAIRAAQLDWEVSKTPMDRHVDVRAQRTDLTHAIVRQGSQPSGPTTILGWVKADYVPLQNREAFRFFDPIVGHEAAVFHTAGALGRGERIWILAKLPIPMEVAPNDLVDKFLLLSNSHDGTGGVEIRLTPIRVVCANTLSLALRMDRGRQIAHSSMMHSELDQVARSMSLIHQEFDKAEAAFRQMTHVRMTGARLDNYLRAVLPNPTDSRDQTAVRQVHVMRQQAAQLFRTGKGNQMPGVRGTLWAAYNAVTEVVDHIPQFETADQHLHSIWFGSGAQLKERAFRVAHQGRWLQLEEPKSKCVMIEVDPLARESKETMNAEFTCKP